MRLGDIDWIWLRTSALALFFGYAGGSLFTTLGLPLPWTLGSLTAAAILAIAGVKWALPVLFRNFARPTLGVMAGSSFTLPVALAMLTWWTAIPMLLGFYVAITILGWLYFTRICKQDDTTAIFSATPGGLGELTLLGSQLGGNIRVLVLVHTIRVMTAVIVLPFLVRLLVHLDGDLMPVPHPDGALPLSPLDWALLIGAGAIGFVIGRPFKRMGGIMLFPLFISIGIHVTGLSQSSPPQWLVILMQVIIGSIAGSRFAGITGAEMRTTALQGFGWAIIMLGAAFLMAVFATNFLDISLAALVLAFAPGGFAEMTILAYAIGIEVAFVVTCHVLRAISVLLLAPTLAQLLPTRNKPPIDPDEQ